MHELCHSNYIFKNFKLPGSINFKTKNHATHINLCSTTLTLVIIYSYSHCTHLFFLIQTFLLQSQRDLRENSSIDTNHEIFPLNMMMFVFGDFVHFLPLLVECEICIFCIESDAICYVCVCVHIMSHFYCRVSTYMIFLFVVFQILPYCELKIQSKLIYPWCYFHYYWIWLRVLWISQVCVWGRRVM